MHIKRVELGERSYTIFIGLPMEEFGRQLHKSGLSRRSLIVSNHRVFNLYGNIIADTLKMAGIDFDVYLVPDGEQYKSLESVEEIYTYLIKNNFDRGSQIIALGGGVIGDMAGFVAATYLRGIDFIQMPTTLLAQVDASIGGKVGVNHKLGKNLIGAFHQPRAVLIDVNFLHTLNQRELANGMAEVIKYAMIKDSDLFNYIEENLFVLRDVDELKMETIVYKCAAIKADVVMLDEREGDLRRILNFGHTIGHAIETAYEYTGLKHGEAVALGMVGACIIAKNRGYIGDEVLKRLKNLLKSFNLPTEKDSRLVDFNVHKIIELIMHDKKVRDGNIFMVLPKGIGNVVIEKVSKQEIIKAINACCVKEG